jgi:outer membrane receptor for ferrienterochelin and colicins
MRMHPRMLLAHLFLLALTPAGAAAQTGAIAGTIHDSESGAPLVNARVEARQAGDTAVARALSDAQGNYRLSGLGAGVYTVVVNLLGYEEARISNVRVSEGAAVPLRIGLQAGIFSLNPIVITASRRQEKALDAPATVTVVNTREIQERPAITPTDHVRNVPGVDIIQQGIQATNVVARGFNNIFSTTLHTLSDYRLASIPSLRVNLMHFIPANNEDIERIEVVLGPGAALYGPNTSSGVMHIITRSPLDAQGSVVSLAAGERSVFQGSFRTAHRIGENLGIKVSGQYVRADEWELDCSHPLDRDICRDEFFSGGRRDYQLERYGADARADWRVTPQTTAVLSAGHTVAANGIELTGIGAGQTIDWAYSYVQFRASRDRFFGQIYMNMSDAGETFLIKDNLRIVDDSKVLVGQLQHGLTVAGRHTLTYGTDGIFTMPDTRGTIHGRNDEDDYITEVGAYIQTESNVRRWLDVVLAGRVDHHSRLETSAIFSPRAALVFKPNENHSFRTTFNQAFSTPVSFTLFLDLDAGPAPGALGQLLGYKIRAMGTEPSGFTFHTSDGGLYGMRSPFAPAIGYGRGDVIPVDATAMWTMGVAAMQQLGRIDAQTANMLHQLAPQAGSVGINVLNLSSMELSPLGSTTVPSVPRAEESRNTTYEIGYKGILGGRILLNAAAWRETRSNFASPLTPFTPLLLLDSIGIYNLVVNHVGPENADAIAAGMRGLPLGVAAAPEMDLGRQDPLDQPYLLASYRNFGSVSLMGVDLSTTAMLTDQWALLLAGSYVSKDHFFSEGFLVGLNAPTRKLAAAIQYRNANAGYNGELRMRYNNSFPVASAPYSATKCIATPEFPLEGLEQPCIPSATLLDVNVGYRLPFSRGTSLQLSVTNVLDTEYRSFVAVPPIGRLALLRVRHEF